MQKTESNQEVLFTSRRFFPLFWTMFLGAFNDNVFKNAIIIAITFKSIHVMGLEPKSTVILSGAIFIFPFFLFSPLAGELAEKYSKQTVMKLTKISEALIMALAAVGFLSQNFGFLLFVLFLMGAQSAFFGPLKYGVIPELVKQDEIVKANAYISSGTFVSILFGTIIGGLLGSSDSPLFIGLSLVAIALIGFTSSLFVPALEPIHPNTKIEKNIFKTVVRNFKLVRSLPEAHELIQAISWYWVAGALILSIIPTVVKDSYGATEEVATMFLALFTVGMGVGSIFFERVMGKTPDRGISLWCLILLNLCLLSLCFLIQPENHFVPQGIAQFLKDPSHWIVVAIFFLMAFFGGGYIVPLYSQLQISFAGQKLAQLIAGNNIYNAIYMVLASVGSTIITMSGGSIRTVMLVLSGVLFLVILKQYLTHIYSFCRRTFHVVLNRFYDVEYKNLDKIPADGSFIMIANHVSFVDWAYLIMACPRHIHFVIDHIYYFNPMLTWFFKQGGLVPIAPRKESEEVLKKAYGEIYARIDEGKVIGMFPEGWLSRDGKLKKFQPGIQKILKERPVPVLVGSIHGLWGSWFSFGNGTPFSYLPNPFKKRKVVVDFHELVHPYEYCPIKMREVVLENIDYGKCEKGEDLLFKDDKQDEKNETGNNS